ncbi:MAG: SUMF1/EgtB/PvdO family nonheme iron enzyme [Treponema sp.]|nr:SUMF1/EgtB/PvdO family nonheme iron enzyme [Treponema sp.]
MREKQTENEDQVKLKHYFGIRPGVYLTVIYSIVLLIIIFFFLIFPGIKNPGSVIIVKTNPAGAAIRVNDVYMGLSGSRIFVPKGSHTITAVMPGFESQSAVQQIPSRIFASLLFPKKVKMEFTLETNDPTGAFAYYASDFASWTFGGEPSSIWQIPMSLSQGAYRVGPYGKNDSVKKELNDILLAASRFTVTQAAMRDLIRAKVLINNNGNAPSAPALISSISDAITFLSVNTGSAQWLCELLPSNSPVTTAIESSDWHKFSMLSNNTMKTQIGLYKMWDFDYFESPLQNISILMSGMIEFGISEMPITNSMFETFLNENPQWREHKTDYFPEEININTINTDAVTGITWYAAHAFCEWLTNRYIQPASNMEFRLPTEKEWQVASFFIENMSNSGWEWCADYYAPLSFINAPSNAVKLIGSPERSILGRTPGSTSETRAYLPPDLSSPFVTFRIVYAEKE